MRFPFLLLILGHLPCSYGIVNPDPEGSATRLLQQRRNPALGPATWKAGVSCLADVSDQFFRLQERLTRAYNLVVAISSNMSTPAEQIQQDYLIYMHDLVRHNPEARSVYQVRTISDAEVFVPKAMGTHGLLYADFYVIVLDRVEQMENLMKNYLSRMKSWNAAALFLVMYHNAEDHNRENETTLAVFETFNSYYVHNVAMLYATSNVDYNFNIMMYYMNVPCRVMGYKRYAKCEGGQLNTKYLYEKMTMALKRVNYRACTIQVCASISPPFVEEDCILGLELRIIGFIRSRLGFKMDVKCAHDSRGIVSDDGELSGLLSKLNNRECDVILGGFYPDDEVMDQFRATDTYLEDSHTFFIQLAPEKQPWMSLYSIFKSETWLCFIFMMVITWFFWYAFVNLLPEPKSHRELSLTGVNNMAVSICYAVNERPTSSASRIFFISLALYGLNVTSTYTSKLIEVLANPGYMHQIDSLDETIREGIPFGGYEENRDWFDAEPWIQHKYNFSPEFEPTEENLAGVVDGKRVILSSRMFILQSMLVDSMHGFSKNIFSSPLLIIVKPGFTFLTKFNYLIRRMRDVGIMMKIDREFRVNNTYVSHIAKIRPHFPESVIVLTTSHLQGPFAILVVGISASTLSLIGELLYFHFIQGKWLKHKKQEKPKQAKMTKSKRNPRKTRSRKGGSSQKLQDSYTDRGFEVQIIRPIRFTPLNRRKVYL